MNEYKRLTEIKKMNEYCYTVECGEHCEDCYAGNLYERLAELEEKIENGTLIELPCKENQEVYIISNKRIITTYARTFNYLGEEIGLDIQTSRFEKDREGWLTLKNKIIHESDFGKTVFLTKAEAEAKLKELREKDNEREVFTK